MAKTKAVKKKEIKHIAWDVRKLRKISADVFVLKCSQYPTYKDCTAIELKAEYKKLIK